MPTRAAIARFKDLCIDTGDVTAAARFWSEVLGLAIDQRSDHPRLTGSTPQHTVWIFSAAVPVARRKSPVPGTHPT